MLAPDGACHGDGLELLVLDSLGEVELLVSRCPAEFPKSDGGRGAFEFVMGMEMLSSLRRWSKVSRWCWHKCGVRGASDEEVIQVD